MLFFRSEERIDRWCAATGHPRRPAVRFDQLWSMATTWYGSRLAADSRRPAPDEIRGIFAALGLTGEFWDPKADVFS